MKALLVDDSPASLTQLKRLVEAASSLQCVAYSDPVEALAAAQDGAFDLAIVDYTMPGMDGIALTRSLRAIPAYASIPIIMVTASVSETVRIGALEAGATDFLPKSPDPTEIKVRLRNMINLSIALHKLNDQAMWLAREVEAATRKLLEREEEMIFRLSLAVEYRDNDTGGHTLRVARYSRILAEELGLSPAACRSIYLAAPLHDVGKVAIPDAILLKPGRLDRDEFAVIEGHAAIGERILSGSCCQLIRLSAEIAGAHHERWDGTGYPDKLSGRLIPLAARIVAIADVFDALTTVRPYKTALSTDEAFAHIERERGRHFDPTCVDRFLAARDRILGVARGEPEAPPDAPALPLAQSPPAADAAEAVPAPRRAVTTRAA